MRRRPHPADAAAHQRTCCSRIGATDPVRLAATRKRTSPARHRVSSVQQAHFGSQSRRRKGGMGCHIQRAGLAAACLLLALAGCGSSSSPASNASSSATAASPTAAPGGAPSWPAPPDPLQVTAAAGLKPERFETLIHHVHSHLDVFVNGVAVRVPAGIGINIQDPGVQRSQLADGSTGYGGIQRCAQPCISPLHTHDDSGILHTESASSVPHRLGQFFIEWGVRLTPSCVGGYCPPTSIKDYVDGQLFGGDPRTIELTNAKEIAIVIGRAAKDHSGDRRSLRRLALASVSGPRWPATSAQAHVPPAHHELCPRMRERRLAAWVAPMPRPARVVWPRSWRGLPERGRPTGARTRSRPPDRARGARWRRSSTLAVARWPMCGLHSGRRDSRYG